MDDVLGLVEDGSGTGDIRDRDVRTGQLEPGLDGEDGQGTGEVGRRRWALASSVLARCASP
jgi:hypothetical protein